MDREEVIKALIVILEGIQTELGEDIDEVNEHTRPIGGVRLFDSLMGVTATVRCVSTFGIDETKKIVTLFEGTSNGIPFALSVGEIADKILKLTKGKLK